MDGNLSGEHLWLGAENNINLVRSPDNWVTGWAGRYETHLQPQSVGELRVTSDYGYIDLGPKDATYCHIYTDRGSFYMNKPLNVDNATTTTTAVLMQGYSNVGGTDTLQFVIRADGDFESRTNSYGATSDIATKQDVVDAPSQWDDIKAVQLRKYRLIDDVAANGDDALVQLGVVAQEIEAAGLGGLVVDADPDNDKPYKSVKYSVLLLKALGALQEAMARIEALEAN